MHNTAERETKVEGTKRGLEALFDKFWNGNEGQKGSGGGTSNLANPATGQRGCNTRRSRVSKQRLLICPNRHRDENEKTSLKVMAAKGPNAKVLRKM